MTLTVTMRQNATRTPGESARLTSVELSENATTSPTTATMPSVSADHRRGDAGNAPGGDSPTDTGRHAPIETTILPSARPASR